MTTSSSQVRGILMTADTVGGVWTYAMELARALEEHRIEVALAIMGAPLNREQRGEARRIAGLEIFESYYKLEWMDAAWPDVEAAGEWLLELEERVRPDVVHLNGYVHAALPWRAPALVVGHSCVLSWWQAVKGESAPAAWDVYRERVARGLHAADLVVAPTWAMLDPLNNHYEQLRNARVIPNGRDEKLFAPAAKEEFVLTAGRLWDEAKNVKVLQSVAPRVSWPVFVAGEEQHPGGGSVDKERRENVRFLGRLSGESLADMFARASIYALPARYEPFGLSALEAALSGCALVLGDIPSLRENWEGAAVFVAPDDEETLAAELEGMIKDNARRRALAGRARDRALQFSPERMAQNYIEAYSDLLAGAGGGKGAEERSVCAS